MVKPGGLAVISQTKLLIPAFDDPARTDHALEGFAARVGRVELGTVFQPAAVLSGDQRALDYLFAIAWMDIFDT